MTETVSQFGLKVKACPTQRPLSNSFLGLPYRILNVNPQTGTTQGPMGNYG